MHETILLVEDDPEVADFLETALRGRGFKVLKAAAADRALMLVREQRPDLVLLDLVLPGLSGWDLLRALRRDAETQRLPVIAMSAREKAPGDAAEALYEGADDFFVKPVEPEVVLARVEAHLRRKDWDGEGGTRKEWVETSDGRIRIHLASRMLELKAGGQTRKRYDLTPKEFELLSLLVRHEGEVLRRPLILDSLWPMGRDVYPRTVDKLVENLRRKLATLGRRVETVSGIGYVLRPAE